MKRNSCVLGFRETVAIGLSFLPIGMLTWILLEVIFPVLRMSSAPRPIPPERVPFLIPEFLWFVVHPTGDPVLDSLVLLFMGGIAGLLITATVVVVALELRRHD